MIQGWSGEIMAAVISIAAIIILSCIGSYIGIMWKMATAEAKTMALENRVDRMETDFKKAIDSLRKEIREDFNAIDKKMDSKFGQIIDLIQKK